MKRLASTRYVVCLRNEGYPEALELRKRYRVISDPQAGKVGHLRLIDESGEDYLYPKSFFGTVRVSQPIKRALAMR
jgi:hypothetical protein